MDLDDDLKKDERSYKKRLLKYLINYIYEESFNEFINNKSKVDESFLFLLKSVITPEKEELLDNDKDYMGKILISDVIYNFSKYLNTNKIDYLKRVYKQLQNEVADKITYLTLIKIKVSIHKKMLDLINKNELNAEDKEEFDKIIIQDELVNKSYLSSQDENYSNETFYLELCDIFKLHYGNEPKSLLIKMAKSIHEDDIEYDAQNDNRSDKGKSLLKFLTDGQLPYAESAICNGDVDSPRVFNDQATSPHVPRSNSAVLTTLALNSPQKDSEAAKAVTPINNSNTPLVTQLQKESAAAKAVTPTSNSPSVSQPQSESAAAIAPTPTKNLSNKENVSLSTPISSKKQEPIRFNNTTTPRILRSAKSSQSNVCQSPPSPPMDDEYLFDDQSDNQKEKEKNKKIVKKAEKEEDEVEEEIVSRKNKNEKEKTTEKIDSESESSFHMSLRRNKSKNKSLELYSDSENEMEVDKPTTSQYFSRSKRSKNYLEEQQVSDKRGTSESALESENDSDKPNTSKSITHKKLVSSDDSDDEDTVYVFRPKLTNQQKSKSPKKVEMNFKLIPTDNSKNTENSMIKITKIEKDNKLTNNDKKKKDVDVENDDFNLQKKKPIAKKSEENKRKSVTEKKVNKNEVKRTSAATATNEESDSDNDSDDETESGELSCVSITGTKFVTKKEKQPIKRKLDKKTNSDVEEKPTKKEMKEDPDYHKPSSFKRRPWTDNESIYLVHGFLKYGRQWALILKTYGAKFNNRTQVNLKDRYRSLENNPSQLRRFENISKKYSKNIEDGVNLNVR